MAFHFLSNFHTHTCYSDGSATPSAYIESALQKGFVSIGFSDHAYAPYDLDCCMRERDIRFYREEIHALRERYRGRIQVCLGLESDAFYPADRMGLDFIIGSVHYVQDENGNKYCIDDTAERFEEALRRVAGGDVRELVRRYYAAVAEMALTQKPDIVGHLDLITKLNAQNRYFDPMQPWYEAIAGETAAAIGRAGCIVEVNTAGMRRSHTDNPYPSGRLLQVLHSLKIPLTISSDAHCPGDLDYGFEQVVPQIRAAGYRCVYRLEGSTRKCVEL